MSHFEDRDIDGGTFRHHRLAPELQKQQEYFEDHLEEETLERFEELFTDLNDLLPAT